MCSADLSIKLVSGASAWTRFIHWLKTLMLVRGVFNSWLAMENSEVLTVGEQEQLGRFIQYNKEVLGEI